MELPDGSHKLANVGGITGDLFTDAWGEDAKDWIGKSAEVDIRHSNNTSNDYIVLVPVTEDTNAALQNKQAQKTHIPPLRSGYARQHTPPVPDRVAAERGEINVTNPTGTNIVTLPDDYEKQDVNPDDIPFY